MYVRVRDIGTILMDETSPAEAIDIVSKKAVVFKQYDIGSAIWFDLDVNYNDLEKEVAQETVFVTFKLTNSETLESEIVYTVDGTPVCILCSPIGNAKLQLMPPAEVMDTPGKYSFEINLVSSDGFRLTSKAIFFTVIESIKFITYPSGE